MRQPSVSCPWIAFRVGRRAVGDSQSDQPVPGGDRRRMDSLSEVLKTIRLTGAAFFESELRAPWSIVAPSSRAIADALMPEADHLVPYHLVTAGRCVVKLIVGPAIDLVADTAGLWPHADDA